VRDGFVRGQRTVRLQAAFGAQHLLDHRHAGGAADQQQSRHVAPRAPGFLQHPAHRQHRAIQQLARQRFELLPRQTGAHPVPVVGKVQLDLVAGAQRVLRLDDFPSQPRQGVLVLPGIHAELVEEALRYPVDQPLSQSMPPR
jgi:hypothetical protein